MALPGKVLHVLESSGLYGKERVILELMEAQQRAGLVPVMGGIGRSPCPAEQPVLQAAAARGLDAMPLVIRGPGDVWRLWRDIGARRMGLVHAHDYKSSIVLAPLRRLGVLPPLIRTLHGFTSIQGSSRLVVYESLDRWSLRWHDAVVAVSGAMRTRIRRKVIVIENGITVPSPFACVDGGGDPDLEAARTFCRDALVLGSLARLAPEKNLGALIEAVAVLNEVGMATKLIMLGEGRDRVALTAAATRLGVEEEVWLPGFKANVRPWLALFDLYLQPSWTEGLPIAVLEAMHAGVPLLVTPVGGMNEILAAGAAVEIPFAGRDIAAVVRWLRQAEDGRAATRAVVARATALACERYSSGNMSRAYGALYEQVLAAVDRRRRDGTTRERMLM